MKKILPILCLFLLFAALTACGNSSNTNVSKETKKTEKTEKTATKKETPKPVPPKEYTADDVINKLKEAGLAVDKTVAYTESTDTNELLGRPGQYVAKTNFGVTELETDGNPDMDVSEGGSVELFANETDAKARYDYVSNIAKSSPMLSEYDYLNGKMLLRLSNSIVPSKAQEYQTAFESLK